MQGYDRYTKSLCSLLMARYMRPVGVPREAKDYAHWVARRLYAKVVGKLKRKVFYMHVKNF